MEYFFLLSYCSQKNYGNEGYLPYGFYSNKWIIFQKFGYNTGRWMGDTDGNLSTMRDETQGKIINPVYRNLSLAFR